jgi:pimeloyl-ACP methyl ester carboxylesterase
MDPAEFAASRQFASTPYGRVAYVERGAGPVALFFHGAFLNGYQWRDVVEACAGIRRCIAFDNLSHGHTQIADGQALDFNAQAEAAAAFLDALGVDQVDLVGNDSGGAIAQVFAARWPQRVRSLALTNCDVYTNSPPPAFQPTIDAFRAGRTAQILQRLLNDIGFARTTGFGQVFEEPERLTPETLAVYLGPLTASSERTAAFERFVLSLAPQYTVEIAGALRRLEAPTLIAWGTEDPLFDVKWAYWLAGAIPGARPVIEVEGARTFWPEERPDQLSALLRDHWAGHEAPTGIGQTP